MAEIVQVGTDDKAIKAVGDGTLDYVTAIQIVPEIEVGKLYDLQFEYDHFAELVKALQMMYLPEQVIQIRIPM